MNRSYIQGNKDLDWKGGVLFALLGVQAIVQISIFLALFLSMADTFLFRVGLLGVLLKKFRSVLLLHPIYFAITLIAGSYRLRTITNSRQVACFSCLFIIVFYFYFPLLFLPIPTTSFLQLLFFPYSCSFLDLWHKDTDFFALSVIQKLRKITAVQIPF